MHKFNNTAQYHLVREWFNGTKGLKDGKFYGAASFGDLKPHRVVLEGTDAILASEKATKNQIKFSQAELHEQLDLQECGHNQSELLKTPKGVEYCRACLGENKKKKIDPATLDNANDKTSGTKTAPHVLKDNTSAKAMYDQLAASIGPIEAEKKMQEIHGDSWETYKALDQAKTKTMKPSTKHAASPGKGHKTGGRTPKAKLSEPKNYMEALAPANPTKPPEVAKPEQSKPAVPTSPAVEIAKPDTTGSGKPPQDPKEKAFNDFRNGLQTLVSKIGDCIKNAIDLGWEKRVSALRNIQSKFLDIAKASDVAAKEYKPLAKPIGEDVIGEDVMSTGAIAIGTPRGLGNSTRPKNTSRKLRKSENVGSVRLDIPSTGTNMVGRSGMKDRGGHGRIDGLDPASRKQARRNNGSVSTASSGLGKRTPQISSAGGHAGGRIREGIEIGQRVEITDIMEDNYQWLNGMRGKIVNIRTPENHICIKLDESQYGDQNGNVYVEPHQLTQIILNTDSKLSEAMELSHYVTKRCNIKNEKVTNLLGQQIVEWSNANGVNDLMPRKEELTLIFAPLAEFLEIESEVNRE